MVAVVSGNGLGLFNSSLTQLGSAPGGQAGIGQSRDSQYLNIATGNLLLTGWDESLFGRGLSTGLVRTYNSAGSFDDTGADGWQTGYERSVRLSLGAIGQAGSQVQRETADGAVVTFEWNASREAYVSTAGDGAHDTIVLSGTGTDARWLWTEGSSQTQETYTVGTTLDVPGRLERIADLAAGAAYDFTYTGSQLTKITGAGGESLEFGYDTITGALVAVSTRERNAAGDLVLKGQVTYGYDIANRLSWVQTDLTPDDATDNTWDTTTAANNDGKRFRTTYTYDASSLRITNVSSSDGVSVTYSYDEVSGRVASITQGSASDGSAQTLTYTYNAGSTDVTDSAGRTWTYQYDGSGQLTAVLAAVLAPAVNGQRQVTNYSYDADGNVTRISQGAYAGAVSLDTVFRYDANGNVLLQRDLLGNTVERTYNAANRVLTEAVYTTPDADGLDPDFTGTTTLPAGALVTRYVYDATNLNQLRFVINAAGEVSEHQYYGTGPASGQQSLSRRFLTHTYDVSALATTAVPTLAQMSAWLIGKEGQTSRSDVAYDAQGRITQTVAYATVNSDGSGVLDAAAAITNYTYDAQGLLRQKIAVYGASRELGVVPTGSAVTDYLYDGLGRLLGVVSRDVATAINDDPNTVSTTYSYFDAANQLQVTLDSGAVRIEARNQAGLLLSVSEADAASGATVARITRHFYDAAGRLRATEDASEARSYFFYDAAGRLTATVDATGAVTETRFDEIGRAVQTVRYATLVNTSTWLDEAGAVTIDTLVYADTLPSLSAGQAWVDLSAASDRNAYRSYDDAGRLETETDAAGLVTTYTYDGASRLLSTTVSQPGDVTVTARVTRYFHDAAGRQVGTLDAAGYLTESLFDAGGRLVQTVRYASSTAANLRASASLDELRASAVAGPLAADDQRTRYFYDGRGQQVGVLNAEGYLTEFVSDEKAVLADGTANLRAVKAYALQLSDPSGDKSFGDLRTSALAGSVRVTERRFNGLGQLVTERNSEDTVTKHSYDEAGRLVRTESAHNTSEVRENFARYDVFGQLIGELSGQQAADAMTAFAVASINDLSEAQRDAAYAQFGTTHSYDLRGQRIESIDAKGTDNTGGNKTWYFYDANGRNTFTIRGVTDSNGIKNALGEVTETRYSAFGQVQDSIAYTGHILLTTPDDRASVQRAVATLSMAGAQPTDSRRQFGYDQRGLLVKVTDAENVVSNTSYTAFGQVRQEQRAVGTTAALTIERNYDERGYEIGRIEGVDIARSTSQVVDAFGRVTSTTDARGNLRTFAYDRLGRQISRTQVLEGRSEFWQSSYDAFSQVVEQIDALGRKTTYAISDNNRSVTITTPELIVTTSVHNRFGQTVTATDGNGATTTFSYDKNGALLQTKDALNQISDNTYDVHGLLTRAIDASGHRVDYTYDAVGRVLTRIEDPTGLALTTTTSYDAQGRQLTATDATGRETRITYDREGRVLSQAHDPSGLNLRTNYTWDAAGRQLTVVEAADSTVTRTTQYIYDELGRRTQQIVDPGTLKLTTSYAYDANDNLVGSTDATGNLTRYAYDEANRLRFSVDALGGVTETAYDANGRVTMTRQYVKPISLVGLPAAAPRDALSNLVSNDLLDLVTYRVYDRDGRMQATIDRLGDVTLLSYDGANNVTESKRYVQAVTLAPEIITSILAGTASAEEILGLSGNVGPAVANQIADQTAVREQAFNLSFANTFSDPNGDTLTYTYTKLTGTADWLVFDANARTFSGTPSSTDGNVTIRLTAADPAGLSVSEDFVITLTTAGGGNEGPVVANQIADQTAVREQAFTLSFANTFSDANGDSLTYTYTTLTGTADWLVFDANARTFSGMPGSTDGNVTIRLTATDPGGMNVSEDFVITLTSAGVNVGPEVANPIADQTAVRQQFFSFTVPANTFVDANGDDLTYSYTKSGTSAWLIYDAPTRTFSGNTPTSSGADAITINFKATDPDGLSVTDTFVITLVAAGSNTAPVVANPIADQTAVKQEFFSFTFPANTFSDANGDDLTYTFTKSQAVWLSFNAETRTFSGSPNSYSPSVSITVTATDPGGLSVTEAFVINVVDSAQFAPTSTEASRTTQTTTTAESTLAAATTTLAQSSGSSPDQVISFAYDAAGRVLRQTDGTGGVTRYVYDAAGRTVYTIDPLGNYTRNWFDQAGRLTATRQFSTPLDPAALSDASTVAQLDAMLVTSVADQGSYFVYDAGGKLRYAIDLAGTLTESTYDSAGRQVSSRTYVTAVAVDSVLANKLLAGTAAGSLNAPAANDSADRVSYSIYNELGQVRMRIDGAGNVVTLTYDAAGRVTTEKKSAQPADISTLRAGLKAGTTTIGQVNPPVNPNTPDMLIYHVYDAAGRQRFTINSLGHTSEMLYDAAGRQVGTRSYFNAINLATQTALVTAMTAGTAVPGDVTSKLTADAARDRQSYVVFDGAGQSRFAVDVLDDALGLGYVVETRHDAAGRVIQELAYLTPVAFSAAEKIALAQGKYSATTLAAAVSGQEPDARKIHSVYDATGQLVYSLTQSSATQAVISERRYDAAGRVIAQVNYGVTVSYDPTRNQAEVEEAIEAADGNLPANQRLTRSVYDAAGRLRFSIDGAGAVSEQVYDALGQVTRTCLYATPIDIIDPTVDSVTAAVAGQADVRETSYTYDNAGRLKTVTDDLTHKETYTYDALGQRTSLTNKLEETWTYQYDSAGRLTTERSPEVSVRRFDGNGVLLPPEDKSIVTTMTYDGMGNVLTRTENAEADVNDRRTTTFTYDARGLQIRTTFPAPWVINTAGKLVSGGSSTYVETIYDALGNAVVQRDVFGNYSYKAYDTLGRLAYDIDAAGYATGYAYNAYGEQTGMTRYAGKLTGASGATPVSVSQIKSGLPTSAANDRTLTMRYDMRGNKTDVTQHSVGYTKANGTPDSGSPRTEFLYDAYGNLAKESVLLEGTTLADTYHYYDKLGQRVLSVDAEGFVTAWTYSALGQVLSETQYARAMGTPTLNVIPTVMPLPGDKETGYDRRVTYGYDAIGRRTSETTARHFRLADGSHGLRNVVTETEFDAADRVTAIVADGVRTETKYDALGRATSVTEASRQALTGTAWNDSLTSSSANSLATTSLYINTSPYTETAYDAYGNAVRIIRYANGKVGTAAAVADATNDQISVMRYDHLGRMVLERDGTGAERYREYDAAGQVSKVWYRQTNGSGATYRVIANYTYDKTARQITSQVTRQLEVNGALQGSVSTDTSEQVRYNAFGEIVAKGTDLNLALADSALPEQFQYDAVGRMIRTNSGAAAYRDYGYDLAGRQIVEKRTTYTTGPGTVNVTVTNTVDKLGRVTRQALPSYAATSVTTYVHKSYDRWGNVIEVVDACGYQTSYEYNELNQVVREIQPLVKVVSEAGVETWSRPERFWFYDAMGRMVGSRDANGAIRQQAFDAAGRLMSTRDGEGYTSLIAYDALGREVAKQDALGYITYQTFDRADHVLSQGDFLLTPAGSAREQQAIQTYLYDIDGNRIGTTDVLSHSQTYDYDSRQLMLRSQSATNAIVNYAYDLRGNKIKETTPLWSAASTATTDRDGDSVRFDEKTWKYDYFGRLTDYNDLGKNDSNYVYNAASGLLVSSDSSGALGAGSRTMQYFENGLVRQITLGNGDVFKYEYDANGNRTKEDSTAKDGNNMTVRVVTRTYYDSHNRIIRVTSDDVNTGVRQIDMTYDYDANGNRRRVTAQTGYKDEGNVTLPTGSTAPVAIGTPPPVGLTGGTALQFRMLTAELFRDPDFSTLTFSAKQESGSNLPSWLSMTTDPVKGHLVFATTASAPASGTYRIKIIATEAGTGLQASTTFTLVIGNDLAPNLIPDVNVVWNVRTGYSWSQTFNAADYFVDYDLGDELTFSLAGVSPASPSWLSGTSLGNGLLQLSGSPTSGQAGTYQVSLKATDRKGASSTKVITINVKVPAQPVASTLATRTIFAGRAFVDEIPLATLFTDANGDTLQVTAAMSDGKALPPWMSFIVDRNGPAPMLRLDGAVPFGTVTGTTYAVRFTATDPGGLSTSAVLNLTVQATNNNSTPTITSSAVTLNWTGGQAGNYTFAPSVFGDANGDTLSIYLMCGHWEWEYDPDWGKPIKSWVAEPAPDWIRFDNATRSLVGTPPATSTAYSITDMYLYATDVDGACAEIPVTLNVAAGGSAPGVPGNQAPVLAKAIPNQGAIVNTAWAYLMPANTFTDPEGQALTLTVTQMPSWMSFDAATGLFKGNVPASASSWTIKVTASDGSASTFTTFTLTSAAGTTTTTGTGSGSIVSSLGASAQAAATPSSGAITQDYWYTYDKENRVKIAQGGLLNGAISVSANAGGGLGFGPWHAGYMNIYDGAGRAVGKLTSDYWNGTSMLERSLYTERGQLSVVMAAVPLHTSQLYQGSSLVWSTLKERRFYDDAGRLEEIQTYMGLNQTTLNSTDVGPLFVPVSGWMEHATTFSYTNDNQVQSQSEYGRIGYYWVDPVMTANGGDVAAAMVQQSSNRSVLGLLSTTTTTRNRANAVTGLTYQQFNVTGSPPSGMPVAFTHNYTYTNLKADAYLENTIVGTGGPSDFKAGTTTSVYDAYGHRKSFKKTSKATGIDDELHYFSYGADGQILTRWDGTWKNNAFYQGYTPTEEKSNRNHYVYANGEAVASVDHLGRMDTLSHLTGFDSGLTGANSIVVQVGDTLESLAQRVYGNSSLWYVIASANAIKDNTQLAASVGMTLKAPDVKTSKNDASTFRPYNPAEIVGDTTPNVVYVAPPPAAGCSAIATIIRIVVAIAIAVNPYLILTPLAAMALGAGGELMAQAVEITEDIRPGFDIGGIAVAGLTAGSGGGATAGMKFGGRFLMAAAQTVGNKITSFAINKALGREDHWNWKSLAASAVAAGLTAGIFGGSKAPFAKFGLKAAGKIVATAVAKEAMGYAVNKAIIGEAHWSWAQTAGSVARDLAMGLAGSYAEAKRQESERQDAVGNALGNAAVRGMQGGGTPTDSDEVKRLPDGGMRHEDGSVTYGVFKPMTDEELLQSVSKRLGVSSEIAQFGSASAGEPWANAPSYFVDPTMEDDGLVCRNPMMQSGPPPLLRALPGQEPYAPTEAQIRIRDLRFSDQAQAIYAAYIAKEDPNVPLTGMRSIEGLSKGSRPITRRDVELIEMVAAAVDDIKVTRGYDPKDPHSYSISLAFDGTGNNRFLDVFDTNPAILESLVAKDGKRSFSLYMAGIGTDGDWTDNLEQFGASGLKGIVGASYGRAAAIARSIYAKDPSANINISVVGFSRGSTQALDFANALDDYGFRDARGVKHEARIGAMLLFDTVESVGLPGTNLTTLIPAYDYSPNTVNVSVPKNVDSILHLTSRDENRLGFPLTVLKNNGVTKIYTWQLPGSHADVGGGYPGLLSRYPLAMGYSYLTNAGVPMSPLKKAMIPPLTSPLVRIHDSAAVGGWADSFDRYLDQTSRFLGLPQTRGVR